MSVESEIRPISERYDELQKVHNEVVKRLTSAENTVAKFKKAFEEIIKSKSLDKVLEIARKALGITDKQRADELEEIVEILKKALEEAEKRKKNEPQIPWTTQRRCPFCIRPLKLGERCHCQDYVWPVYPSNPVYPPRIWCSDLTQTQTQ